MIKKIIIILSTIILVTGLYFLYLIFTNYGYECVRESMYEKSTYYLKFNIFGKLIHSKEEVTLYFETKEEAKKYYDEDKKRNPDDNILLKDEKVIFVTDNFGVIFEDDKSRKIVKKTYENNSYVCKEKKL